MKPILLTLAFPIILLTGCAGTGYYSSDGYYGSGYPGPGYYDGGYYGSPIVDVGFYGYGGGYYHHGYNGYNHYDSGYRHAAVASSGFHSGSHFAGSSASRGLRSGSRLRG